MGRISHGRREQRPSERLRTYLDGQFRGRPSELARQIEVSGKVAENLLLGHWPSDTTWSAIVTRFGRDVLAAVFEPDIDPVLARLAAEERQLEERLETIRARRRAAKGPVGGDEEPLEASADEADQRDPLTLDLFGDAP